MVNVMPLPWEMVMLPEMLAYGTEAALDVEKTGFCAEVVVSARAGTSP